MLFLVPIRWEFGVSTNWGSPSEVSPLRATSLQVMPETVTDC